MCWNSVSYSGHEVVCVVNQNHFVVFWLKISTITAHCWSWSLFRPAFTWEKTKIAWHKHTTQRSKITMCNARQHVQSGTRIANLSNQTGCSIQLVERTWLCEASVIFVAFQQNLCSQKNQCQPKTQRFGLKLSFSQSAASCPADVSTDVGRNLGLRKESLGGNYGVIAWTKRCVCRHVKAAPRLIFTNWTSN